MKIKFLKLNFTLTIFMVVLNIFCKAQSDIPVSEKNSDIQLEHLIGWVDNVGYFLGEIKGEKTLISLDSNFHVIEHSVVDKEIDGVPYQLSVLLGHNLYSFYFFDNSEKKKKETANTKLTSVSIDLKTLNKVGKKELGSENLSLEKEPNGDFKDFALSANRKYIIFYSETPSDAVTSIRACTFDTSLNQLNSCIFNNPGGEYKRYQLSIDNKGDGFISVAAYHNGYYLLYLPKNDKSLAVKVILKGNAISTFYGLSTANGNLIICGGYGDSFFTKGAFVKYYDKASIEYGVTSEYSFEFDHDFINKHSGESLARNEFVGYNINSAYYNELSQNLIIVADRIIDDQMSSNVLVSVISSSGKSIKNVSIPRYIAYSTTADFTHIYTFESQNKIYIIFNDDVRNTSDQLADDMYYNFRTDEYGCISEYVINEDLSITSKALWKYPKKNYLFEFAIPLDPESTTIGCFWTRHYFKNVPPSWYPIVMMHSYKL